MRELDLVDNFPSQIITSTEEEPWLAGTHAIEF